MYYTLLSSTLSCFPKVAKQIGRNSGELLKIKITLLLMINDGRENII